MKSLNTIKNFFRYILLTVLFFGYLYAGVPSVTITDDTTEATTNSDVTFTFTFSEGVNDFVASDVTVVNGTPGTFTGDNNDTVFTLVVTPTADFEGDITVDVANGVARSDSTTEDNTAATQATQTVDTKKPTVTISLDDTALKVGDTATVTITFSEVVSNFDNADITIENGTLSAITTADDITYSATFTPTTDIEDTTNTITVNTSDITDSIGNALSGNVSSANYTIDTKKPTVSISLDDTNLKIDENATVTITFSEVVSNFDNADLTIENGTLSGVGSNDGNITFTATFTPTVAIEDTTNTISVNISDIADTVGNSLDSVVSSANYTIDTKAPIVSISLSDTALKIGDTSTVTITFSEEVLNFENSDVTIQNGTLSTITSSDDIVYSGVFTPTQGITDTNNTITVNTSDITDTNTNPLSSSFSSPNYTIDTNISTPTTPNLVSDSVGENGTTTDNITNDNTPDINGTNSYGETVDIELFDEFSNSVGSVTSIADGNTWDINASALADGVHNITLEITDTAGNKKRTSTTLDITIDTQIGLILNIDDGYINSIEQNSDHNVSGSVTSVEVGQTVTIQNNLNNSEVNTTVQADGSFYITVGAGDWNSNADGTYDFNATVEDIAGNSVIVTRGVILDTNISTPTQPDLNATSDSGTFNDDNITNDTTPLLNGVNSYGESVQVSAFDALGTNIGTALNPTLLGNYNTSGEARGVTLSSDNTKAFVADEYSGLQIIDITTPSAPTLLGTYNTSGYAYGVTLSSDNTKAFVADGWSGLQIIDITTPSSPTLLGTYDTSGRAYGVTLSSDNTKAFVADSSSGLQIIDITTPSTPLLLGTYNTSGYAYGVTLSSDNTKAFVADGSSGLQIIDITTPSAPTLLGTYDTSGNAWEVTLSSDNTKAFVADSSSGLQIIDITTPSAPSLLGTYDTQGGARGVTLSSDNTKAFVAYYTSGLQIIDITTPSAPSLIGTYDTSGAAFGVTLSSDNTKAFVADGSSGLQVIELFTANGDSWSIETDTLSDGEHNISIKITDMAGNESNLSVPLTLTIDTTIPDIPSGADLNASSDSNITDDDITNDNTPTFTGTAVPGEIIEIFDGNISIGKTFVQNDGNWSIDSNTTLSDGDKNITITLTDLAGNESNSSIVLDINIDTVITIPSTPNLMPNATFQNPQGIAIDTNDNIYIADTYNHKIRKISPDRNVTTFIGDTNGTINGDSSTALLNLPNHIAFDSAGNMFATDSENGIIRKITPAGDVTTLSLDINLSIGWGIAIDSSDTIFVSDENQNKIYKITNENNITEYATGFNNPKGIKVDDSGVVYVADSSNNAVKKIDINGTVTTIAIGFNSPSDIALDKIGNIFVADTANNVIKKIDVENNNSVSTFATGFVAPMGVEFDSIGNLIVSNRDGHTIQKVTFDGVVSTIAGDGTVGSDDAVYSSDNGYSRSDNITNNTTVYIQGTSEDNENITIYENNVSLGQIATFSDGSYAIAVNLSTDGVHNLTATSEDLAGNGESNQSSILTITLDTTAPSSPTIEADMLSSSDSGRYDDDNLTNDTTPTFTLHRDINNTSLNIYLNDILTAQSGMGDIGDINYTSHPLDDGNYTLKYTHIDMAGNESNKSVGFDFIIDTTISITLDEINNDLVIGPDTNSTYISGTTVDVNDGEIVYINYLGSELNGTVINNEFNISVPQSVYNEANNTLPQVYIADINITEAAGNIASDDENVTIDLSSFVDLNTTIDRLNPDDLANDYIISGYTDIENGRTVAVTYNGTRYETVSDGSTFSITVPSADITNLTDGMHEIVIDTNLTDLAGNIANVTNKTMVYDEISDDALYPYDLNLTTTAPYAVDFNSSLHELLGDVDWFSIDVGSRGVLSVDTNDTNITVSLYDFQDTANPYTDEDDNSIKTVVGKSKYYIKVDGVDVNSSGYYNLQVSFTPLEDEIDSIASHKFVSTTTTVDIDITSLAFISQSSNYIKYNDTTYLDITDKNNIVTKTFTADTDITTEVNVTSDIHNGYTYSTTLENIITLTNSLNTYTLDNYNANSFFIKDDYLYTVSLTDGLVVYEISDDTNIKVLGQNSSYAGSTIIVDERYAYIANGTTLTVVDIREDFKDIMPSDFMDLDSLRLDENISLNNWAGEVDTDIFKLILDKTSTLNFELSNKNLGNDLNLTVSLDSDFSTSVLSAFDTPVTLNANRYYVKIVGNDNVVDGKYNLKVTQTTTDSYIDKVTNTIAKDDDIDISSFSSISSTLEDDGDVDMFKITIPYGGVLDINVTNNKTVSIVSVDINSSSEFSTQNTQSTTHLNSGIYFIKVSGVAGDYSLDTSYTKDIPDSNKVIYTTYDTIYESAIDINTTILSSDTGRFFTIDENNDIKLYDTNTKTSYLINLLDSKKRDYIDVNLSDGNLSVYYDTGVLLYDASVDILNPKYISNTAGSYTQNQPITTATTYGVDATTLDIVDTTTINSYAKIQNNLFVATNTNGIYLYDISNPATPKYLRQVSDMQNIEYIRASHTKLFIKGETEILILDFENDYSDYMLGAVQIAQNVSVEGGLPLNDVDYFEVVLNATGDVTLNGISQDINTTLIDKDGNPLLNLSDVKAGKYYIKLENSDINSVNNYNFTASQNYTNDEDVDTINFVTGHPHKEVSTTQNNTGDLVTTDDLDYFKLITTQKTILSVTITDNFDIKVYLDGGSEIVANSDGEFNIPKAGNYYIEVSGTVIGDYTFTVSLEDEVLNNYLDQSSSLNKELTTIQTQGDVTYIEALGEYLYAIDSASGLLIYNVDDITNISLEANYQTTQEASTVKIDGNYAYIIEESNGLEIVDVTNKNDLRQVAYFNTITDKVYDVAIDYTNSLVHIAAGTQGIISLDISNPLAVTQSFVTTITDADIRSLDIKGDKLYAVDFNSGIKGYSLGSSSLTAHTDIDIDTTGGLKTVVNGDILYMITSSSINSFDISSQTVTTKLDELTLSEVIFNIELANGSLYLMSATQMYIVDIEDSSNLTSKDPTTASINALSSTTDILYYGKQNEITLAESSPDYADSFYEAQTIVFQETYKGQVSLSRYTDKDVFVFDTLYTGVFDIKSVANTLNAKVSIYSASDEGMPLAIAQTLYTDINWDTITPLAIDDDTATNSFTIEDLTINEGRFYVVIEDALANQAGGNYEFSMDLNISGDNYIDILSDTVKSDISVTDGVIEDTLFGTSGDKDFVDINVTQRSTVTFTQNGEIITRITLFYDDGTQMTQSFETNSTTFTTELNPGSYKVRIDSFEDDTAAKSGAYNIAVSSEPVEDIVIENGLSKEDITQIVDVKYLGNYIYVITENSIEKYTHLLEKKTSTATSFGTDKQNNKLFVYNSLSDTNKIQNYVTSMDTDKTNQIVSTVEMDTLDKQNTINRSDIAPSILPYLNIIFVSSAQKVYMYNGTTLQVQHLYETDNAKMLAYSIGTIVDMDVKSDGSIDTVYILSDINGGSLTILEIDEATENIELVSQTTIGDSISSMFIDTTKELFYVGVENQLLEYDISNKQEPIYKKSIDLSDTTYKATPSDIYKREDMVYMILPSIGIVGVDMSLENPLENPIEVLGLGKEIDHVFSMDHRTLNYTTQENNTTRLKVYFFEDSFLNGETDSVLSGEKPSEGCFIATAAYGSYFQEHVKVLRDFRDEVLLKNSIGKIFVESYYEYSPSIADTISQSETLKMIVRVALTPFVYMIKYPAYGFLLFIGVIMMIKYRKREVF